MLLSDAIQFLAQVAYVCVFVLTLAHAIRRPTRANVEIALFFGAAAMVVALGIVGSVLNIARERVLVALSGALLMALPYLLLRLAASFSEVSRAMLAAAGIVLAVVVVALFVSPQPFSFLLTLALVIYFVVVVVAASVAFVRQAARASGVTRRRLQCVAWGSACLGMDIFVAGLGAILPDLMGVWTVLGGTLGLSSGVLYYVGFASPAWLRRAWQEPALRGFLLRSARLVVEPDMTSVLRDLEDWAGLTLGAQAAVGTWSEARGRLIFHVRTRIPSVASSRAGTGVEFSPQRHELEVQPGNMVGGQAFAQQKSIFTANAARDDPQYAEIYRLTGSQAAMAAPISVGSQRLGVLTVYAPRAPIFADGDIELLELLADQAAVVLQSRMLIEESARARARDEANRLKDEFLANISHDLRNPLTAVRGVAQVLQRRVDRDLPIDEARLSAAMRNIEASTTQMAMLIDQLLDHARLQMERPLELTLTWTDLVELARRTVETFEAASDRHRIAFEAPGTPIVGEWDGARVERVVQNLVANAIKFSPDGGEVLVRAAVESDAERVWAVVMVQDHGVGIPSHDLPHIFDRFHRATNVADIQGSGLGLAASRQVIEQHGGSISVTSEINRGSTFVVRLPLVEGESPPPPPPPTEPSVETERLPTDLHVALNGGLA